MIVYNFLNNFFHFRAKFHKLKYGTELNQGDMKPPTFDDEKNGKYLPVFTMFFCHLLYYRESSKVYT